MRRPLILTMIASIFCISTISSNCYGVNIVQVKESKKGKIQQLLPDNAKETIILVRINGVPFGEFLSGGKTRGYAMSPSSIYAGNKIPKIAETMHKAGIKIDQAIIEVLSDLNEADYLAATDALKTALMNIQNTLQNNESIINEPKTKKLKISTTSTTTQTEPIELVEIGPAFKQSMSIQSRMQTAEEKYFTTLKIKNNPDEQKSLEVFLDKCLHAESLFIDKLLHDFFLDDNKAEQRINYINIFGNRDPCFQCQLLLHKLADLIGQQCASPITQPAFQKIRYYSENSFTGPCFLPPKLCHYDKSIPEDYKKNVYSSRLMGQQGKLLSFDFRSKSEHKVYLFKPR